MTESGARILYEFSDFRLDLQQRLLLTGADARPIPLSPKVFDTLLYFVERRGELLDKATLMKAIWPNIVVEENNLNQNISALRRALGESPGEHRFILTEPGRGYRFVADVRTVAAAPSTVQAPAQTDAAKAPKSSIAVLPFANLTRDPDKEYFSDGMADELIHLLARVPGLKVPARTSVFAYKGRDTDVRQIARDLEVAAVLEGSVRSAGERIRVTAQLIDGATGYHVWSESYDRKFDDVFKLQDELASAIVRALKLDRNESAAPLPAPAPPTADIEAYHLYLQARGLYGINDQANLRHASQLLRQAVERDPKFARAHAFKAMCEFSLTFNGWRGPDGLEEAERDARRALTLDSGLTEPRAVLAQIHAQRGNWCAAEEDFRATLAAEPRDPTTHNLHAVLLLCTGELRRAGEDALAGHRYAPLVAVYAMNVAITRSIRGADVEALRYADLGLRLGFPADSLVNLLMRSNAAYRAGRYLEAAESMLKILPPAAAAAGGAAVVESVDAAMADRSKTGAALTALGALSKKAAGPQGLESPLHTQLVATWYTCLNQLDEAFAAANRGVDHCERESIMGTVWGGLWVPELKPFRKDARFQALVTRLGMMEYWREYGPPDDCELVGGALICR